MNSAYSFSIYESVKQLPAQWNSLATSNIFLTSEYLEVLEESAPQNMNCFYIGIFKNTNLVGISLSQFLDLNKLESFGERDKCIKTSIRNFLFRNFSSHVLFIGNNMLTGQNAFRFSPDIESKKAIHQLHLASNEIKSILKKRKKKVHITTIKDFESTDTSLFETAEFDSFYKFTTQPNMVFCSCEHWYSFDDYIADLSKKYRDQYKRCRKKAEGIQKQKMSLTDIIAHEKTIFKLYHHVAKNAPFNTFFLARNHFSILKEKLKDNFLFYGYFENEKLVGFNTLIKNGNQMDTYFLGYNDSIQREKMLYLNMLYDMIAYSINKGFKEIVFARTALEIKSSVGAKPMEMFGFIQHSNPLLNKKMSQLFNYLEPKTDWNERNPFK